METTQKQQATNDVLYSHSITQGSSPAVMQGGSREKTVKTSKMQYTSGSLTSAVRQLNKSCEADTTRGGHVRSCGNSSVTQGRGNNINTTSAAFCSVRSSTELLMALVRPGDDDVATPPPGSRARAKAPRSSGGTRTCAIYCRVQ